MDSTFLKAQVAMILFFLHYKGIDISQTKCSLGGFRRRYPVFWYWIDL